MAQPRIAPLTEEEMDTETAEMLAGLGRGRISGAFNIFKTLAHHPKLMRKWSAFGGALLFQSEMTGREREILILRTGWNCQSEYEWGQHKRIGMDAGLTEAEVVATTYPADEGGWSAEDRDLIDAADELHTDSKISDATWEKLAARYSKKQLIEILMTVGQYHLVAMALNSLGVERDEGVEAFPGA